MRFSNEAVVLPTEIQEKIDTYWQSLLDSGKTYKRGEVFTVTHVDGKETTLEVLVEKTDYAHYLYCQNIDLLGEYGVRIIHTAVLVITADNQVVFGRMGEETARAGIHQLCGGGIDLKDLRGDVFDFAHNITNELMEELGIDASDESRIVSFEEKYLKSGGPTDKMTAIFEIRLKQTAKEFEESYRAFEQELREKGEEPEFGDLVILPLESAAIKNFFSDEEKKFDEYMKPLFEFLMASVE